MLCVAGPFFYAWPVVSQPAAHRALVSFASAPFGALATPFQFAEETPDMTPMIGYPKPFADNLGDASQRPKRRPKTMRLWALQKHCCHCRQLLGGQLARTTRAVSALESGFPIASPGSEPLTGRIAADAKRPGNCSRPLTRLEQRRSLQPPSLFRCKRHPWAIFGIHAAQLTCSQQNVIRFCETQ